LLLPSRRCSCLRAVAVAVAPLPLPSRRRRCRHTVAAAITPSPSPSRRRRRRLCKLLFRHGNI
jgi:hypothetical protein